MATPKQLRRTMTLGKTRLLLSAALMGAVSLVPGRALAQTDADDAEQTILNADGPAPNLQWTRDEKLDTGVRTFVAMNSSGFVVEVHESPQLFSTGLYYHLGKLKDDGTVEWGPSRRFSYAGTWPAVAINDEGYVIMTRSSATSKCCSDLDYYVGTVQLNGSVKQEIAWKKNQVTFDSGFHNGLGINAAGSIAELHESSSGGLFYRLGHLKNPKNGEFSIEWDTGKNGIRFDSGVDPRISINNNGDVVEVHGVAGETYLHYTRGTLGNGRIDFSSEHPRYDNKGRRPSVVLLNDASVLETNETGNERPVYRLGLLSSTDRDKVAWGDSGDVLQPYELGYSTSVAANVGWAITILESSNGNLYYTTARLP